MSWQARALRECARRLGTRWLRGRVLRARGSGRTAMYPWWARPARRPHGGVRVVVGPPSWTLLLLDELERDGRPVRDVLPRFRAYIPHGMDFAPYEDLFRRRLGRDMEIVPGDAPPPDEDIAVNAFGERLTPEDLRHAAAAAAFEHGCELARFDVDAEYPHMAESRGRHVWRCAFRGTPPDLALFAAGLDRALAERNRRYARHRKGPIRPPHVRLVPRPDA